MHALVRDYARRQLAEEPTEDETTLLLRAARFWELQARQSKDLWDLLRARDYYYRAGEYEKAFEIVAAICDYLYRWGHIELVIRLLNESAETTEGREKSAVIVQLAKVYEGLGDYRAALKLCEEVWGLFEEAGDKPMMATTLHQIGVVYQQQGNYSEAQARYEQSLAIEMELGNKGGIAYSLGNLGTLHYLQGDYQAALEKYEECLRISRELGDKSSVATGLHQLGMIHQQEGNYSEAQARYEQSLAIFAELGDEREIAMSLHNLGVIHQQQGNLGEAQAKYEQSLAIKMELSDKLGIAHSLHQLGMIHQEQGSYREALEKWVQALTLWEQLGSPDAETARHNLALLREEMGEEAFAAALAELGVEAEGVSGTGAVTLEQAVDVVVQNTVAVMTEMPEQREEWWGALGQLLAQVRQQGDAGFAAFLGAVQQVVEGADPARVRVELEEPFAEAWRRLVEGLQQRT
jgi:tetratricopeptide (TPR) repeat protein